MFLNRVLTGCRTKLSTVPRAYCGTITNAERKLKLRHNTTREYDDMGKNQTLPDIVDMVNGKKVGIFIDNITQYTIYGSNFKHILKLQPMKHASSVFKKSKKVRF